MEREFLLTNGTPAEFGATAESFSDREEIKEARVVFWTRRPGNKPQVVRGINALMLANSKPPPIPVEAISLHINFRQDGPIIDGRRETPSIEASIEALKTPSGTLLTLSCEDKNWLILGDYWEMLLAYIRRMGWDIRPLQSDNLLKENKTSGRLEMLREITQQAENERAAESFRWNKEMEEMRRRIAQKMQASETAELLQQRGVIKESALINYSDVDKAEGSPASPPEPQNKQTANAPEIESRDKAPGNPASPDAIRKFHHLLKTTTLSARKLQVQVGTDSRTYYQKCREYTGDEEILLKDRADLIKKGRWPRK